MCHTESDVIGSRVCSQNCQDYSFTVLDIFPVLTTAQAKNIPIAQAITIVGQTEELTQCQFVMWFVDVFFMIVIYDAVKNYMFLEDLQLVYVGK